jgi:hypothetical protein
VKIPHTQTRSPLPVSRRKYPCANSTQAPAFPFLVPGFILSFALFYELDTPGTRRAVATALLGMFLESGNDLAMPGNGVLTPSNRNQKANFKVANFSSFFATPFFSFLLPFTSRI